MKLPRFTLRRLMVAVAAVGLIMGLAIEGERRRSRFLGLAERYGLLADCLDLDPVSQKRAAEHYQLYLKYDFASRYPWLPVAPDPLGPE